MINLEQREEVLFNVPCKGIGRPKCGSPSPNPKNEEKMGEIILKKKYSPELIHVGLYIGYSLSL